MATIYHQVRINAPVSRYMKRCRVLLEAEATVFPKCGAVSFGIQTGPAKPGSPFLNCSPRRVVRF
jgi:hypothetical protein